METFILTVVCRGHLATDFVLFSLCSLWCLDIIVNVELIWTDLFIIPITFLCVRMIPTEDASARKREIEEKLKQVRQKSQITRIISSGEIPWSQCGCYSTVIYINTLLWINCLLVSLINFTCHIITLQQMVCQIISQASDQRHKHTP